MRHRKHVVKHVARNRWDPDAFRNGSGLKIRIPIFYHRSPDCRELIMLRSLKISGNLRNLWKTMENFSEWKKLPSETRAEHVIFIWGNSFDDWVPRFSVTKNQPQYCLYPAGIHHRPSPGSRLGRHLEQIRLLAVKLRRQLHLGMTKKMSKDPSKEYHRPKTTIWCVYIYTYITYLYIHIYIHIYLYMYLHMIYAYVHAYNLSFRSSQPPMQSDPSPSNEQRVQTPQETHRFSSIRNGDHLIPSIIIIY